MTRYALDTNIYLRAARTSAARGALRRLPDATFRRTVFLATVWEELQAGTRSPAEQERLDDLVHPYLAAGRMLIPSARSFQQAGRVLMHLSDRERLQLAGMRASLLNDVLIAVTAREHDAVLVTENVADFQRIARHLRGLRHTTRLL